MPADLTVSEFCDLAWVHFLDQSNGGMSSIAEIRPILQAIMQYDETRSVDQVSADMEAARAAVKRDKGKPGAKEAPRAVVSKEAVDQLRALMDKAKQKQEPGAE